MKTQMLIEEAIATFRENETLFGDSKQDKEKANLYRGLAALAEAVKELQDEVHQAKSPKLVGSQSKLHGAPSR